RGRPLRASSSTKGAPCPTCPHPTSPTPWERVTQRTGKGGTPYILRPLQETDALCQKLTAVVSTDSPKTFVVSHCQRDGLAEAQQRSKELLRCPPRPASSGNSPSPPPPPR